MKGKGAKTIKKVVSIILALAMVVTGVNYTPVSVNAADRISIQLNGKTYTVEKRHHQLSVMLWERQTIKMM